jgi:Na+/H+ antiporter NhaD/arsenite permease-like protein
MTIELTHHWAGYTALAVFCLALILVILEEFTGLRKSKPMLLAAGIIWGLIAWQAVSIGNSAAIEPALRVHLLHYMELMLLILVVMTYVNALGERHVFRVLRAWIGRKGYSYRQVFWLTGTATFLLSPFLNNLATSLLLGAVILGIGVHNKRFIALGCLNIVLAANAGGTFSPFGDFTTLLVWLQNIQTPQGTVEFSSFFHLVVPALIGYLIPATALYFSLPRGRIEQTPERIRMRRGASRIMLLFVLTITTAVLFRGLLDMPVAIGMLTGLSFLQIFGFYLKRTHYLHKSDNRFEESLTLPLPSESRSPFDVFAMVSRAEWDTLLFLYGISLAVGGLGYLGYLELASHTLYGGLGANTSNVLVGLSSAFLDNIPVMYAVVGMSPSMSQGQWLLVTLTTGLGGSLLSIGSAAGVALTGYAKGKYTFFTHLRWTPVIALGFVASVLSHHWLNSILF